VIAVVCFIVLPAIALSQLALSVRRERLSRPPQTRVPPLVGLDDETAKTLLHNSKLNMPVLANRYDPPVEPGKILFQTPQAGEFVDCGTVVGLTIGKNLTTKSAFLECELLIGVNGLQTTKMRTSILRSNFKDGTHL